MNEQTAKSIVKEFLADFEFPLDDKAKSIYIGNDELEAIKYLAEK